MIETSAAYKDAVTAHRQRWDVRATIDYSDFNLDNSIQPIVQESDRLSIDEQMANGIEITTYKFFPGWEYFTWGSGYHLKSETKTDAEQGAMSERLSFSDGNFPKYSGQFFGNTMFHSTTMASDFQNYPRFSITFSPRSVQNLKAVFDQKVGQWATDFDVNLYVGDTLDHTETVTDNTTYRWTKELTTPILQCTQVEIVVKKWNKGESKAKVVESFTSIQEEYDISNIIDLAIYEESEPEDATIPIGNVTENTCNLTLINENNRFDNDNVDSILAGNVIKNRRIKLYATLEDQEIPLGTYYSQKWKVNNKDLQAEVSGRDLLFIMDDSEYTKDQFITPGADENFSYSTDSEFNTFQLDNIEVDSDSLKFGGSAVQCENSVNSGSLFGNTLFSSITMSSFQRYCGTATKSITFTYTPATTVTASVDYTGSIPTGAALRIFASHKQIDEYTEINGDYVFVPEDISETSQTVKFMFLLEVQSTDSTISIDSIDIDLAESITLYSIAAKVIDDFDDDTDLIQGNYFIDDSYADIQIPNAFIIPMSYRDVLKLVTQAGGGRGYVGREGQLRLEAAPVLGSTVKSYDSSTYFEKVQPVNPNEIYNRVSVTTRPFKRAGSAETLAETTVDIPAGESISVSIKFDEAPADGVTETTPSGVDIDSSTVYTWGVDYVLTNTTGTDIESGDLTVSGYPYRVTGSRRVTVDNTESIRKNGVIDLVIEDNDLIQSVEQAEFIANALIDSYEQQRRAVELDGLPDPSLEIGDTIGVDGAFYKVAQNEIEYGKGELLHSIGGKR